MKAILKIILATVILYGCSPINKQHGYLLDDILISSDKIAKFNEGTTSKDDIFLAMGSPSVEIDDINNIWIYILSIKERNVFESDNLTFQTVFRFVFDQNNILIEKSVVNEDQYTKISFSKDVTKVRRSAYGITDQLYDAFTRGQ
jgi:outer membrane protein assembly factor BamE (lipoprotein component of BamABCDE complex)